ncbi:myosin-7a binding protein isoform X2 [Haematobia irritans]|uniref:myosin-7a binding protein isoform X2 n=1 Tax=Haematobia irritans TaxID=7368 RepID=UPI003F50C8D2
MNTMPLKNLENSLPESSPKPLLNTSPTTPLTPLIVTSIISPGSGEDQKDITIATSPTDSAASPKDLQDTSRNSDSGKSSSCSPTLLDCSFDSGIAGVLLDTNDMQLHKRIQQCQRILLALERDRENFSLLRNRLSKISDRKKRKLVEGTEFLCNVCCAEINPEDAKTFVKCYICQKYICRSIKCADWLPKTAQWECELCQTSKESMAQTSSWVADQISFNQQKLVYPMRARSEIYIPISECNDSSIHFESVSQIGATSALITAEQKLKIREYVEEIVSQMLGGNLDTISVNQLTKSENYLPASKSNGHILNQHSYLNGSILRQEGEGSTRPVSRESTPGPDFTDISETRLRSMIQKIITETIDMPPLSKTYAVSEIALDRPSKLIENGGLANGHRHRTEHYFEPTIYQDLLATAVLNKIVDKQSVNNRTISESSPDLTRDIVDGVDLDQNYNNENNSVTSGSSIEPRSDCSYTDTEPNITTNDDKSSSVLHTGRESVMSDYLAGHMVPLPDLSNIGGESEEDDYMSVTSSAIGDSTWENNWLFKKKKLSGLGTGSVSTSSIGMLVPDPKEDVRAQIGDKTADEISDLSELGSDTDDSSMDLLRTTVEPINDRLFNKHLIGGQNSKMVLDELIERSSMISNTLPMDQEDAYAETRNMNVEAPSQNEAINTKVNHQNMSTITNNNNNHEDQNNLEVPTDAEEKDSNPLADFKSNHQYTNGHSIPRKEENKITDDLYNKEDNSLVHKNIINNSTTKTSNNTNINNTTKTTNTTNGTVTHHRKVRKDFTAVDLTTKTTNNGDHHRDPSSISRVGLDAEEGKSEDDDDVPSLPQFVPGSIAEREYKKWYNAVEMPNNPYAPEALKRRISGSQERFIDLPNINKTSEQCPLEMITKEKLENNEADKRESEYRRYSRDYYINDGSKSSQASSTSPVRETPKDVTEIEQKAEQTLKLPPNELDQSEEPIVLSVYKAMPAQVVEDSLTTTATTPTSSSSFDTISQQSLQSVGATTSDDSDTVKIYDFKKQETTIIPRNTMDSNKSIDKEKSEQEQETGKLVLRPTVLNLSRQESSSTSIPTPTRGSTPPAFKFLQPKRKLLDPSQILSVEEGAKELIGVYAEKPVIEKEVAHALPSVKALAKVFLTTPSTEQQQTAEKVWLRKTKVVPAASNGQMSPLKLIENPNNDLEKWEEDVTITSDLSSLETDPSSVLKTAEDAKDDQNSNSPTNAPENTTTVATTTTITTVNENSTTTTPPTVPKGVLKTNIAFFENLKNK